jgi:hypothetical protein
MTHWEIHGSELTNCNCAYGCPCQFNALPTHGTCEAALSFHVDKGHYGEVTLDGLNMAMVVKWPGPIHKGEGRMQMIIDERASPAQREAVEKIMRGEDTDDMATMWWVFSMMSPHKEETLYRKISYTSDIPARIGEVHVDGVFDLEARPIRNPVTGNPPRVRIDTIGGFGYRVAEMGNGTTRTHGLIDLPNNTDTYAQFNELHLTNSGIIEAVH